MHFAVFLFVRALIDLTRSKASSLAVQPATGCCLIPLCPTPFRRAPLSDFRALQHHRTRRLLPRGSTLEYRPRPRFRTVIAAILPANPFQAYFIPESAPGLSLQGFLLKCWVGNFRNQLPLVPFPVATDLSGCPRHPTRGLGRLQGIAKHSSSFTLSERVSTPDTADPLLGFFLLRVFPAEENGKLAPPPLMRVCRLNSRRSPPGTRYRVYFFSSGQRLSRGVIPLSRFPATKCLLTFYGEKPPVWRWLVV